MRGKALCIKEEVLCGKIKKLIERLNEKQLDCVYWYVLSKLDK